MAADPATAALTFRPMVAADIDRVLINEVRAYAFPWTRGIFRDCLTAGHECWVAEIAPGSGRNRTPQIVGHSVLSIAVGEAHLLNVCIRRDRQGSGFGRMLAGHMIAVARRHQVAALYLEVRPSNLVAIRLYDSMGFREIGVRKNYYPSHLGNEDARVLALELD